MVRYLSGYKGENTIFTLSKSREFTEYLLMNGLSVGELTDDNLFIYPEGFITDITPSERPLMSVFNECDVLEINERGLIYRWYSASEGDAGIATTALCNSNCIMCPASDKERMQTNTPSVAQLSTVIRHMPKDLRHFTITGGEPTLIGEENFLSIIKVVKEELPDTKILLLTNGRTFGDKNFFQRFISEAPKCLRVAVPIHGSTSEKHDYITRSPGGFFQTIRGVANLLNAHVETEIRIVVSKLNCDDIKDIAQCIISMLPGVTVVNFVGLEMRGNCVINSDNVLISYQEAFAKSKDAIDLLIRNGIDVGLYNFPYCMIDREYWPIAQKSISAYKSVFYDKCSECGLRQECCGIFQSTMSYYKPDVFPIRDGDII